jgi:hypothetical protein
MVLSVLTKEVKRERAQNFTPIETFSMKNIGAVEG